MALCKFLHGDSSRLDSIPFHEGYIYVTTDEQMMYFDINVGTEESPDNKRIPLNAKDAETILGISPSTLVNNVDTEIPTSKAILTKLAEYAPASHNHDDKYYTDAEIDTKFSESQSEANTYTDQQIANLLNNSTEAVDSIFELRDAMENNADAIESLVEISGSKASASDLTIHVNNKENPHNVTKEQLGLYVGTWSGTKAKYDAITTKQDDCLYIITDESEVAEFEKTTNKVTEINSSSDNNHYPTAKAVYQSLQAIDGYEKITNKVNVISNASTNDTYPSAKAVYDNVNNTVNDAKSEIFNTLENRVYGVEKSENKVTEITKNSTHTTYPSAKAVFDAIETFGGTDIETTNVINNNSTADEVPNAKATYDFVKSEINNMQESVTTLQAATPTVYSGTSEPNASIGKIGDIWVVTE